MFATAPLGAPAYLTVLRHESLQRGLEITDHLPDGGECFVLLAESTERWTPVYLINYD